MNDLTLVVLAAGLGSRYGGLKQITPIGPDGEILLDYSLYDAAKAGFNKVVFIIKEQMREDFDRIIANRAREFMQVEYAVQSQNDNLAPGYSCPPERGEKPWGTAHAVLCAEKYVNTPFAVINSDDFYGAESYSLIADYLKGTSDESSVKAEFCMAGYVLKNTLSDNGFVSRGVCETDQDGFLTEVNERLKIGYYDGRVKYQQTDGSFVEVLPESTVSLNIWGFTRRVFPLLKDERVKFFGDLKNPAKDEFLLPTAVDSMIKAGSARVKMLKTGAQWYGVTYREDTEYVSAMLKKMHDAGTYPRLK